MYFTQPLHSGAARWTDRLLERPVGEPFSSGAYTNSGKQ